jgi:hypothetical protein
MLSIAKPSLRAVSVLFCASAAALVACNGAPREAAPEEFGAATARITRVPSGVACVAVHAAGSRDTDVKVDVTAGQDSTVVLTGLPTGELTFTAAAYPAACSAVGAGTDATWSSDAVKATIVAHAAPVDVVLPMHQGGRASVGVDFDDAGPKPAPVTISTSALTFDMDCGLLGEPQKVTVTNVTSQDITVEAVIAGTRGFGVSQSSATVAAGQSTTFDVWPVAADGPAPATWTDALTIRTNAPGDEPHVIPIRETTHGAALRWASPAVTQLAVGASATVTLTNDGDLPVGVTLTLDDAAFFSVTPSDAQVLLPGASLAATVTNVSGPPAGAHTVLRPVLPPPVPARPGLAVCGMVPTLDIGN